jgi:hypothetical protein
MEALLPEEALEDDFKSFDMAVRVLTLKDYDYLVSYSLLLIST